jgi:hypothetical protein
MKAVSYVTNTEYSISSNSKSKSEIISSLPVKKCPTLTWSGESSAMKNVIFWCTWLKTEIVGGKEPVYLFFFVYTTDEFYKLIITETSMYAVEVSVGCRYL